MSTTVKTGWLKDSNGEKFAPKTLISQVQASDGSLLEDKLSDIAEKIENNNSNINIRLETLENKEDIIIEANPIEEATEVLTKIKIGDKIYSISGIVESVEEYEGAVVIE